MSLRNPRYHLEQGIIAVLIPLPIIAGIFRLKKLWRPTFVTLLAVSMIKTLYAPFTEFVQPFVGVDANYSLDLEKSGRQWKWARQEQELFTGIAKQGVNGMRVRLWTSDGGTNGKEYATRLVKRSLAAGLDPYLVIFLSDDWADLMKQPVPAIWKDLTFKERTDAVRDYSRDVVKHFRNEGLRNHMYEIGNEIDYGICGVYPGKSTKKNPDSLSKRCWPDAAKLIVASQQGVRESDPEAKFLLHISHWWDVDFVQEFYRFMIDHGVQVDYTGLSYFPSSNIGGSIELEQFEDTIDKLHAELKRPMIICETAYPCTKDFKGQFATWRKEVPGYPLTPDGQRRWLGDFLDFCAHKEFIASVYYWSPEWNGDTMWTGFSLFDIDNNSRSAWGSFVPDRMRRSKPKQMLYAEIRNNKLYWVPLAESREKATAELKKCFEESGKKDKPYIDRISAIDMQVDGYKVLLRSSLSGNVDLINMESAPSSLDWETLVSKVGANSRLVIFTDDTNDELRASITQRAQESGIDLVFHDHQADLPLKFGLDITWQKNHVDE